MNRGTESEACVGAKCGAGKGRNKPGPGSGGPSGLDHEGVHQLAEVPLVAAPLIGCDLPLEHEGLIAPQADEHLGLELLTGAERAVRAIHEGRGEGQPLPVPDL
eukprot:EG_transcript_34341